MRVRFHLHLAFTYAIAVVAATPGDTAPVVSHTVVADTVAPGVDTGIVAHPLDRLVLKGDDSPLGSPDIVALPAVGRCLAVVGNRAVVAVGLPYWLRRRYQCQAM